MKKHNLSFQGNLPNSCQNTNNIRLVPYIIFKKLSDELHHTNLLIVLMVLLVAVKLSISSAPITSLRKNGGTGISKVEAKQWGGGIL